MNNDKIKCPKCGTNIPVTEVLKHRLNEQVNDEVEKRIVKEKGELEEKIKKEFTENQNKELKILNGKLAIAEKEKEESIKKELEFIKKEEELADKLKRQELIIAQKLKEEKINIEEKIRKEEIEKNQFVIAEMRKQLEDTKKALTEAQRKAQQGSMQTQGEVVELTLEELLKQKFPSDIIAPVPKGVTGADITQKVFSKAGRECGLIAWESKQTKAWTEDWVQKLKDDGRNIKASVMVLVSEVLPKGLNNFGMYKGIWVANFSSVEGLTVALRNQMMAVSSALASQVDKDDKKDILYNYLCGPAFSSKIETIVETFVNMKTALDKEKTAFTKIWSVRETQIQRLTENTAKIYGEIQGIAGNKLPSIEVLELETGLDEITNDDISKEKSKPNKQTEDNNQANLF
jgi:hypothetical protein